MTPAELRLEILREIEKLPEFMLPRVLAVIQHINANSFKRAELEEFLRKSIEEDRELLLRLAQTDTKLWSSPK
jgi:hypothetical protein